MDSGIRPIKRSKELVPLSKEHHEGLLFAWKIKRGLDNGTDHKIIAGFIQWFWEGDLQEHFRKEEQVLAIRLPGGDVLVQQMMEEHQQLEALIRLCAMVQDEDIFRQLADGLTNHIRFEERVLFPHAEKTLSPAAMETISRELLQEKPPCKRWANEFWLKK